MLKCPKKCEHYERTMDIMNNMCIFCSNHSHAPQYVGVPQFKHCPCCGAELIDDDIMTIDEWELIHMKDN